MKPARRSRAALDLERAAVGAGDRPMQREAHLNNAALMARRRDDLRMAVAGVEHGDAAGEVDVAP